MKKCIWFHSCVSLILLLSACGEEVRGLKETVETGGPRVVWDITHRPLPEIPLPNDAATIVDEKSPTGRRLNVSLIADTKMEMETRALINRMDGWGVFSPISVKFDAPLDLEELLNSYRNDFDFKNDVVFVVNIDPRSKDFKKAVHLDMCRGNYPVIVGKYGLFFENDPHYYDNNVIFEEWDEDLNGDGKLDPGEDRDFDNVLDKPNIHPAGACDAMRKELMETEASNSPDKDEKRRLYDQCIVKHLLTCYERETNTLIIRPLEPLDQRSVYAVVLTKRLKGENGRSVQSPFPYINHAAQTDALAPLGEVLAEYGLTLDDVAFTWTFTTQSLTRDFEALRAGLYGFGPFKKLKEEYPPVASFKPGQLLDSGDGNLYKMKMEDLLEILEPYAPALGPGNPAGTKKLFEELRQVDYFVIGVFVSPYFLADKDGVATEKYPADDDESFELDYENGRYVTKPQKIRALCTVPKETELARQPFEVVIYAHGYVGNLSEGLGFAGRMAHFGFATCVIEAMGHGLALPPEYKDILELIMPKFVEKNISSLFQLISPGRARDLNNDGFEDNGGDFWTADLFHTRDVVRQTLIDHLQFIRILRHFDGKRSWEMDLDKDGENELFGDFDANGVVDFGGPGKRYYAWGQSLGGINSVLLGAIEPSLNAVVSVSGAGGITDVAIRSQNFGVPEAVMLPLMGPFVLGNPTKDGKLLFEFLLADVVFQKKIPIKVSEKAKPGDKVLLRNLKNGKEAYVTVPPDMKFRFAVACDALMATEKRPVLEMKDDNSNVPVEVSDPLKLGLGDPLEITLFDGNSDSVKEVIKTFEEGMEFNGKVWDGIVWQGAYHPRGSRLICLQKGHGYHRQSPDLRRIFNVASFVLEAADPGAFGRYLFKESLNFDYEKEIAEELGAVEHRVNFLICPTAGDLNTPVSAGITIARASGILNFTEIDERWGKTPNDIMKEYKVFEAVERLKWFLANDPQLSDPDNLSNGKDGFDKAPRIDPPVRATIKAEWGGYHALRIPYMPDTDRHGFELPRPDAPFDMNFYMTNVVANWMFTKGNPLDKSGNFALDHPCYEKAQCDFFPEVARE